MFIYEQNYHKRKRNNKVWLILIKKLRVLHIFERLNQGELINKQKSAKKFEVSNKAIQRDINDLRSYFAEFHKRDISIEIIY